MSTFTVELHHEGTFTLNPLEYMYGECQIINDIQFEEMAVQDLFEIIKRLVNCAPKKLYYCIPGTDLGSGIRELKTQDDMEELMVLGYQNESRMNLYTEIHGYDVLEMLAEGLVHNDNEGGDLSDDSDPEGVDFHTESEQNVVLEKLTTDDPFLTKLVGKGNYIGKRVDPIPPLTGAYILEDDDPDMDEIDDRYKIKNGVQYPSYNPYAPWKEFQPVLGMKFENPEQLKLAQADYGVAHGYQLWYYRSDNKSLLVYCGRDVSLGRCAGRKKKNKKTNENLVGESSKTPISPNQNVRKSPAKVQTPEKWTRMKVKEHRGLHHCPFRLWASWMTSERSFQIKTLYSDHKCTRKYNMGTLVTFRWIARHYANEIIMNPALTYKFMREDIREKYLIDVSEGQCKRAKQCALAEHEWGLIEHYGKLWEYRRAILESNPGSTCHLDVHVDEEGKTRYHRFYICFKGVKDGWLSGCRRIIGIDGAFISHMCKGQLLTAMGRDANNQMYPIAWAVVDVENKVNWMWFLSLLARDINLQNGLGMTVISDAHKGIIEAVKDCLPQAEHRHCTRHLYANFKRKWSGLRYKTLFWGAAVSTIEQDFTRKMNEIKELDAEAYKYLMDRNPSTWCKAFFQSHTRCAAFKNGISESFNGKIVVARGKPIISMLEDIRIYIMQCNWAMSKLASELEDTITPTVRKRLEVLKKDQRKWQVLSSGYQVVEVRKRDEAFGVNLMEKSCDCFLWNLSGVPCVHAVAAYMHFKMNPDLGVSDWYSQSKWFDTYQYSIKPVPGTKMWKPTSGISPLPPIVKKMPSRPRKCRIKHPTEELHEHAVSRVGKVITCTNCQQPGHNKTTCTNPKQPQAQQPPNPQPQNKGKTKVGETSKATGASWSLVNGQGAAVGGSASAQGKGALVGGSASAQGKGAAVGGSASAPGKGPTVGGSASMSRKEYELMMDEEALREVWAEEERLREEREHNGRIFTTWSDIQEEMQNQTHDKPPTLSELAAVDEAHDIMNDQLTSHSGRLDSLEVNQSLQQRPRSRLHPQIVEIETSESQTNKKPRQKRNKAPVKPRNKSERIAKRRKFNFPSDGTGSSKDMPFNL